MSVHCGKGSQITASFVLFVLLSAATAGSDGQSAAVVDKAPADAAANDEFAHLARERGLVIPREAERVRYHASPSDPIQVTYIVHEPFPAKQIIKEISSRLTNAGWKPLKDDRLNSGVRSPHVRGWSQYVDETDGTLRDYWRWTAAWQDADGDLIEYALLYSRPFRSKHRMGDASISGNWMSAAKAHSNRDSVKRSRENAAKSGQR
jgi:hypothetical protein